MAFLANVAGGSPTISETAVRICAHVRTHVVLHARLFFWLFACGAMLCNFGIAWRNSGRSSEGGRRPDCPFVVLVGAGWRPVVSARRPVDIPRARGRRELVCRVLVVFLLCVVVGLLRFCSMGGISCTEPLCGDIAAPPTHPFSPTDETECNHLPLPEQARVRPDILLEPDEFAFVGLRKHWV